jgi:ectoine hydroxylase-related dioxygenase (phytanoyl-CoA dioxygenase family)
MPKLDRTLRDAKDLFADVSGTYKPVSHAALPVDPAQTAADLAAIRRDGYLIIPQLLPPDILEQARAAVAPYLKLQGRNNFEGLKTQRVYSLIAKTRACNLLVEHPRILALLDQLLLPNYLLSAFQAINILPGEAPQLLHFDDGFYPMPRPRPPFSVATIWAIDDFTADNGATVVLPGSHAWDGRMPVDGDERVPALMPAGSVVVFLGTLWHGGGANHSKRSRLAITAQYCEPWARVQENMSLAIPREAVRECSPVMQSLLGYSIHPPFMGMVNGQSPMRLLED